MVPSATPRRRSLLLPDGKTDSSVSVVYDMHRQVRSNPVQESICRDALAPVSNWHGCPSSQSGNRTQPNPRAYPIHATPVDCIFSSQ